MAMLKMNYFGLTTSFYSDFTKKRHNPEHGKVCLFALLGGAAGARKSQTDYLLLSQIALQRFRVNPELVPRAFQESTSVI